ncbi:unnamed protein product [Periconia digitata]|uniref:Uncharacterized protein n=1 Tax=Periconia digitata TaxID=1303443 RepID=A0A9W4ULE3_9PLEO|nr:unnamed protein product [Periconia digitata]
MERALLVGFISCSSCGILLSIPLLYLDSRKSKSAPTTASDSRLERYLAVIFGLMQIGLLAAVDVAAAESLHKSQQVRWMEAVCSSTLQIYAGVNSARVLRRLLVLPWATPLVYVVFTVSIVLNFVYLTIEGGSSDYWFFFNLAVPSLLSSTISSWLAYQHKIARGDNPKFLRLLILLAISNAISALSQFFGAMIIYRSVLTGREITSKTHYVILLTCTSTHLLCPLVFCVSGARRSMKRAWTQMRSRHFTDTTTEGAIRLDSLGEAGSIHDESI